jgi:hypothetical protein
MSHGRAARSTEAGLQVLPTRSPTGSVHGGISWQHCAATDSVIRLPGARDMEQVKTRGGAPRRRARPRPSSMSLPCIAGAMASRVRGSSG